MHGPKLARAVQAGAQQVHHPGAEQLGFGVAGQAEGKDGNRIGRDPDPAGALGSPAIPKPSPGRPHRQPPSGRCRGVLAVPAVGIGAASTAGPGVGGVDRTASVPWRRPALPVQPERLLVVPAGRELACFGVVAPLKGGLRLAAGDFGAEPPVQRPNMPLQLFDVLGDLGVRRTAEFAPHQLLVRPGMLQRGGPIAGLDQ